MNSEKSTDMIVRFRSAADDFRKNVVDAFAREAERGGVAAAVVSVFPDAVRIFSPVLHFIAAFLFAGASITLGARPFGLAFFAACGGTLPFAFAGAVLRVLIDGRDVLILVLTYALLFVLRLLTGMLLDAGHKRRAFEDSLRVKMAVSVIGALAVGAYGAIADSFSLYSLGAFLLMCSATPALTFLFCGALSKRADAASALYRGAGRGAVAVAVVFSLVGVEPFSFNVSAAVSLFLTVFAVTKYGWIKGAVLGLFFGLSLPVSLVPIFALAGVTFGVLCRVSPYIAISASVMTSLSWTVYAGGYESALAYSPAIIIGGIMSAGMFAVGALSVAARPRLEDPLPHEALLLAERSRAYSSREQLSAEADAFSGMSDMLFRLSDKLRRPSAYDIRELCESEASALCRRCRGRERCWAIHEAEMSDALSKLSSSLYGSGVIGRGDIPESLSVNCTDPDRLINRLNAAYARMLEALIDCDKTEVMAFDYSAMSAVLRDVITQREGEYDVNQKLSARLAALLAENKISARRVCVFGERRRTVFISDIKLSGLRAGGSDLRRLANRSCGGEFSSPNFELSGAAVNATLVSAPAVSVSFERAQSKKSDSSANGDAASGFACRDDRWCAILCDGMGSGREAALTSGICSLFIEKMMSAGNSASVTLKMLNCLLRAKNSECSSTVDLFDLDLLSGKARFIKSGAAPSFVVRGPNVYKISSRTVPVGIIRSLDAEETTITLYEGDVVVLVSDGVTRSEEDCAWLYSMLAACGDKPIADTASDILREADRRSGRGDDATVCVMRIASPPPPDGSEPEFYGLD